MARHYPFRGIPEENRIAHAISLITDILRSGKEMTAPNISRKLKCSNTYITNCLGCAVKNHKESHNTSSPTTLALKQLIDEGKLTYTGGGGIGRGFMYRLRLSPSYLASLPPYVSPVLQQKLPLVRDSLSTTKLDQYHAKMNGTLEILIAQMEEYLREKVDLEIHQPCVKTINTLRAEKDAIRQAFQDLRQQQLTQTTLQHEPPQNIFARIHSRPQKPITPNTNENSPSSDLPAPETAAA